MKAYNFIGKKFGKLNVIGKAPSRKYGKTGSYASFWYCVCDCQQSLPEEQREIISVSGHNLKFGQTVSCGCYMKEWGKNRNRYEIVGDIVKMYDYKNNMFIIDLDDLQKVRTYTWSVNSRGYVRTTCLVGNKHKDLRLHRFVMNCTDKNLFVDHINHNTTDNRKCNLRICTPAQNSYNVRPTAKNKSGVRGVRFDKTKNKWLAGISINGKYKIVGTYDNIEEAVKTRKLYEEKFYGNFRYLN